MAKLGIDGPLRRQGDIFGAALPQGAGQLGNYAAEDPGFGDHAIAKAEAQQEVQKHDAGMEAILDNPFVSPSSGGGGRTRKRVKKKTVAGAEGYGAAKIGMRIVFCSLAVMMGTGVLYSLFSVLTRAAPDLIPSMVKAGGSAVAIVLGVAILVLIALYFISCFTAFLGQIICIFSPNKSEKVLAGLAVGCLVAALFVSFVLFLLGMSTAQSAQQQSLGLEGALAIAISALVGGFIIYALVLGNLFFFIFYFRSIGKNVGSKKIKDGANVAVWACIFAIVAGIISMIVMFVMVGFFEKQPQTIRIAADIALGINVLLGFSTISSIMSMIKTTLDVLSGKR